MDTQLSSNEPVPAAAPDSHNSEPPTIGPPHKKSTKKLVVIALVVLIIGGALAAAAIIMNKKDTTKQPQNSQNNVPPSFSQQYGSDCIQRDVSLTASPIPVAQLGYIEPMGKVQDGHVTPTDHLYVSPKNTKAADNTTDVVMPADGTVVEIGAMPAEYIGDMNQQTAPEDHRLVIAHSCQYFSIFIHVHQLSEELQKAVDGKMQPNTQKRVKVELRAGDRLGKIGSNPVDWTYMDANRTLTGFTTPDLYKGEPWKVHVIDPLKLYSGNMKTLMEDASLRSIAPLGGKIDYDQKDALIGNWFREGTNGYSGASQDRYWDGHLSIAPDYIDGVSPIVSTGNWDGKAAQFAVKGEFDPAKVLAGGGPVKVELISRGYLLESGRPWNGNDNPGKGMTVSKEGASKGTIMFQVLDNQKLKVEKFIGKMPAEVSGFTSAAQMYTR